MNNYSHYIIPIVVMVALVTRRIIRSIGFQKFSKPRLIFRISLLSIVTLLFLITAALHPISYLTDFGGMLLGFGLLYWAMRHTTFENRGTDVYYRTNIWIEIIVVALFLSRIIYRISLFVQLFSDHIETPDEMKSRINALRDPYTGALIFILFAYYIGYSAFILKKVSERNQTIPS